MRSIMRRSNAELFAFSFAVFYFIMRTPAGENAKRRSRPRDFSATNVSFAFAASGWRIAISRGEFATIMMISIAAINLSRRGVYYQRAIARLIIERATRENYINENKRILS